MSIYIASINSGYGKNKTACTLYIRNDWFACVWDCACARARVCVCVLECADCDLKTNSNYTKLLCWRNLDSATIGYSIVSALLFSLYITDGVYAALKWQKRRRKIGGVCTTKCVASDFKWEEPKASSHSRIKISFSPFRRDNTYMLVHSRQTRCESDCTSTN